MQNIHSSVNVHLCLCVCVLIHCVYCCVSVTDQDGTLETLRVTKRRKRRSQVAHSCKLIQPYLRRISHDNIDSLMLHFDLLDQLKQQIGETSQGGCLVLSPVQRILLSLGSQVCFMTSLNQVLYKTIVKYNIFIETTKRKTL